MNYSVLSQRDSRWANKVLGYGGKESTIGRYGCLFISLLEAVTHDRNFDPAWVDAFMACLKDHGNYTPAGGDYLQSADIARCMPPEWGTITLLRETTVYDKVDFPRFEMDAVRAHLKAGLGPVVLEVDPTPDSPGIGPDDTHFVLAIGLDPVGTPVIVDSWFNDEGNLCPRYGPYPEYSIYQAKFYQITTPGTPPVAAHPPVSFSVFPAAIVAGQSTTLIWSVENIAGIWLDGQPEAGVMMRTRTPAQTTTYTLTVQYSDGAKENLTRTVTVTPAPQPVASKVHIGYNVLGNGDKAGGVVNEGCQFVLVISNPQAANALAEKGINVMYREYLDHVPNPDELVNALHPNRLHPKVIRTFMNEREKLPGGVQGIQLGSSIEINAAQKLRLLNPSLRMAAGTFSTGTPDFTKQEECDAIRACYAPHYNSGLLWWDQHTYSPDESWIYKAASVPGHALAGQDVSEPYVMMPQSGPVGRDGHTATWMDLRPVMELVGRITRDSEGIAIVDDEPIPPQKWFETRWQFLFTRCGFNPLSISRVVSGETGVDKNGKGGFIGVGATADQVIAWIRRFLQIQALPILVNGVSYASPFMGAAIFQLGDTSNEHGHWGSYAMDPYTAAIKASGVYV